MRNLLFFIVFMLPIASFAEGIVVENPYLRASGPAAKAAAVFMTLQNDTDSDVVLIAAQTEAARKVELHTHIIVDDVARMRPIDGGITIPAGGHHLLKRGEDHVMLMGLTGKLFQGDMVPLTLIFEGAEPISLEVMVDNERKDGAGHKNH